MEFYGFLGSQKVLTSRWFFDPVPRTRICQDSSRWRAGSRDQSRGLSPLAAAAGGDRTNILKWDPCGPMVLSMVYVWLSIRFWMMMNNHEWWSAMMNDNERWMIDGCRSGYARSNVATGIGCQTMASWCYLEQHESSCVLLRSLMVIGTATCRIRLDSCCG